MKRIVLFFGLLMACMGAFAQDTLYISTTQVVHLRFASELKYVNLGNKAIVAKIVDGSKDFVAVKAREPFDYCTSMSCLESTGAMHTFLVAYREHPSRLEVDTRGGHMGTPSGARMGTGLAPEVSAAVPADSTFSVNDLWSFSSSSLGRGSPTSSSLTRSSVSPKTFEDIVAMKREIYHLGAQGYGIEVLCEHIFVKDDVLFLLLSVHNKSAVSYSLTAPRFAVESKRRTKRGLQYEKAVFPRQSYGLGTIQPDSVGKLVFTFDKLSLTRGQVFRLYFYENGGARNLTVTLGLDDVNGARRLN